MPDTHAYMVRNAQPDDLPAIEAILCGARAFLKEQGSPQWQDGHGPNRKTIQTDIERQQGYVFLLNGCICAYAALAGGVEPSYRTITDGAWDETYEQYHTIHRMAVDASKRGHGIANAFLHALLSRAEELQCHDVRIDTHPCNQIMQTLILKAGFVYKGRIELPIPNGERKAYQRLLHTT